MGMRGIIHNWLASTLELVSIINIIAIVVNSVAFALQFDGLTVKINFD